MKRAAWIAIALIALACAASEPPDTDFSAGAWIAGARAAHARADTALAQGQADRARAALQAALEPPPPAALRAEHVRIVRQDLLFRLSQLELAQGATESARALAERGLALGRAEDAFTLNLLAAHGRALAALGRDTQAASSRQAALAIHQRLLRIARERQGAGKP